MDTSNSVRLSEDADECLAAHNREDQPSTEMGLRLTDEWSVLELVRIPSDEAPESLRVAVDERLDRRGHKLEPREGR